MTLSDLIPWKRNEKTLANRDDSDSFLTMSNEINKMFDNFIEDPWSLRPFEIFDNKMNRFFPRLDVNETAKEVNVVVELPGMDEKDVQVNLVNGLLSISGEKKSETKDKSNGYYRSERSYGSFRRQLSITAEIDEEKVSATFKNGLLTVTLPKRQVVEPSAKKITVKKG